MSTHPDIVLFNTLGRRKEPLTTSTEGQVAMYVCGPTVYNFAHLGNARPAVVFDVLARLLRSRYAKVTYARNLTDIDDKINEAAAAANVPITSITERFIAAYHEDMRALLVSAPDLEPRVTQHMPAIVRLISRLIDGGHAYVHDRHVLFDVASYPDYGHLSGRLGGQLRDGARPEPAPYKRAPLDFVLWKPSDARQPGWDSPWGRGRPGWHIECSAMISEHLGTTIDIHGGGQDLIFPHHENEIAQGTCANGGALYCRTWVHNSFVTVNGQKMSKSLGNVLLVRELLAHAPGEAVRLALLGTHYRYPLDWNAQRLSRARATLTRCYLALERVRDTPPDPRAAPDPSVLAALADDINTPLALARLQRLIQPLGQATTDAARIAAKGTLLASGALLGLLQQDPVTMLATLTGRVEDKTPDPAWVDAMVSRRDIARKQGDYAAADALRKELAVAGVSIEDGMGTTSWRLTPMVPV